VPPKEALRALAFGRIALGLLLVLFPRLGASLWIGRGAHAPGVSILGRALGIRDAIFGGMVLHTADRPEVSQRWLKACATADVVDGVAALSVRRELPPVRGLGGAAVALGSAVAHAGLARQAQDAPPAA
jgi:hypothetical protein